MNQKALPRAEILNSIPSERYRIMLEYAEPPKKGDIVTLDQGFTDTEGNEMVLVYCIDEKGTLRYEADVYETEIGPDI